MIELEAARAFAVQERLKPLLALGPCDSAPVEPLDGNLDSLDHRLHGLRDAFPAKTAAQNRMPLDTGIPDDAARQKLLELAREFAAVGDQALDYEGEPKSPDSH